VKVKKRIRKILEESKTYFAMPIGTGYGNSGVPDFLVCHKGRFIGIEAKANGGQATALQLMNLQKIRDAGGTSLIVNEHNLDELKELLDGND
jgi:pantoate kinase